MKLTRALKEKNRLAGELAKLHTVLNRENTRRNDSKSTVNVEEVYNQWLALSEKLGNLKAAIAKSNIGIYSALERMAEYKSQISIISSLPVREGEEIAFIGRNEDKLVYSWTSYINQEKRDKLIAELQTKINDLQDTVDEFNASHDVIDTN